MTALANPLPAPLVEVRIDCPLCGQALQFNATTLSDGPGRVVLQLDDEPVRTHLLACARQLVDEEHRCAGTDGEQTVCTAGEIYGPCDNEYCPGGCDRQGTCGCTCHQG